jgi:hypothetical protein
MLSSAGVVIAGTLASAASATRSEQSQGQWLAPLMTFAMRRGNRKDLAALKNMPDAR